MSESFYDLVQLTDPHYLADPDGRLKDVHTRTTFVQVLTTALAESPPPVAILLTGDVTQDGSRAGYEGIREDLARAGVPVWSLAGNHDDPVVMAEVMSGDGFHFCAPQRLGPWEVLLVSTWDGDRGGGRVGEAGLQTLARQLAASAAEHILVCLHHQPTPMGCAWLDGVGLDDAADFMAVVDADERIRGLVWGHVHQALDETRGALRLMSTPSTCFQFLPRQDDFGIDPRPPGYRQLRLHDDGRIETAVRRIATSD
jgi:Icc protein